MLKLKSLVFFFALTTVSSLALASDDTLISFGEDERVASVGNITADTSMHDLFVLFGEENVETRSFDNGTPFDTVFTLIKKEGYQIKIFWELHDSKIWRLEISNKKSKWHTAEGLKVGSSLADLNANLHIALDYSSPTVESSLLDSYTGYGKTVSSDLEVSKRLDELKVEVTTLNIYFSE